MAVRTLYNDFVEAELVEFRQSIHDKIVDAVIKLWGEAALHDLNVVMQVGDDYVLATTTQHAASHTLVAIIVAQRAVHAKGVDRHLANLV